MQLLRRIWAIPVASSCAAPTNPPPSTSGLEVKVAAQYATIVSANYKDTLDAALLLRRFEQFAQALFKRNTRFPSERLADA